MTKRVLTLFAALAVFLSAAGSATGEPPSVASKQAQAQAVMGQIQSLDSSLAHAIEAYNLANEKLEAIRGDLRENQVELSIAQTNLKRAQQRLVSRVVAIYTSGESDSTLDVLVGSRSLVDLVEGLEAVSRVSEQDTAVFGDVTKFRSQVQRRRALLKRARAQQAQLVAERAANKASIESRLAERQRMLSSIRSEIAEIRAAEQRRQAELERQARARLAQPQPLIPEIASAASAPEASPSPPPAISAPPAKYGGVVGIAMRYLGTPYVYGGASPSGFDCSGFVMYVYAQVGVSLPHNAAAQYGYGTPVDRSQLQPGDLVFFNGLGHNGIYIGGGSFIHSPHTGDVVKISSLTGWYSSTWVGARRL
ncbi:MAG TPA: NlpC/P60 family protein [Gaiellaceae bacterium]|nr:NlpC/P60 family protein [Gaiellaceae bacterium]